MGEAKRFILGCAAFAVMPGCGCGEHGIWDKIDSMTPFSQGQWYSRRLRWSEAIVERARR